MNQVTAYAILTAVSLLVGFCAGIQSARHVPPSPTEFITTKTGHSGSGSDSETSDDSACDEGISSLQIEKTDECKLVLVVRTDLGMTSGKIAAQCSHATLACYKSLLSSNPTLLKQWERTGQTKVALRCKDEEELLLLQAQARSLSLCARSIQDAGRTQIVAGSRTVLGIAGPGRLVNQVTGKLRLL